VTAIGMMGELLTDSRRPDRVYGVVVGVVTNNQDPEELGRVKVWFPWLADDGESNWARIASPMAGPERGLYFLPEVDDEVLVMFEHGQIDHPFIIGALWNGKDKPPATNGDGKNNLRVIKSRSGHTITLDDTADAEKITISDKTQKNTIVIDSKENTVTITSDKEVTVKAQGNITLDSSGGDLAIKCQSLSVDASKSVSIKAGQSGTVEANSGLALKCLAGVNVNDGALEVR
jgi:phage baseplate assembly protein V